MTEGTGNPKIERHLTERITFRSVEQGAQYGYVEHHAPVASGRAHRAQADGLVVTRKTGAQEGVRVALLLRGNGTYPVARLTVVPQDVRDFLEQYAPEVFA